MPTSSRVAATGSRSAGPFVSAEDFDSTGILTGVDPCESRYWWLAELYGPEATSNSSAGQPAARPGPYAARRPSAPAAA